MMDDGYHGYVFSAGGGEECRVLEDLVFTVATSGGCTDEQMFDACIAEEPSSTGPACQMSCYCSAPSQCQVALLLKPNQSINTICDILPLSV